VRGYQHESAHAILRIGVDMPMHVYDCPNGHTFEKFEGIHEQGPLPCPECGKPATLGVGRTGAPVLKEGTGGFYRPSR